MIEKLYHASAGDSEVSQMYGPFKTAEEAETEAYRLGWRWVFIEATMTDEFGTVLDVQQRFYQLSRPVVATNMRVATPEETRKMLGYPEPLSDEEIDFFALYEKQMSRPVGRLDEIEETFGRIKHEVRRRLNGK
jgi:hypothetical protein